MSVLRVSSYICINSAVCSFQKTGIKNLRSRMPHVSYGIRNIWSIPRFQPIASVVPELQGIWRGCSNNSSGDAVIHDKVYRRKDFDVITQSFKAEVNNYYGETVIEFDLNPHLRTEAEIVMSDLEENLKREKDLEKQLKCVREERDVLNDAWYKLYKENQNLAIYQTD